MRTNTRDLAEDIARERIEILFGLARECAGTNPARSISYVRHLKKISVHSRVGLPKKISGSLCKKCGMVLVPGLTARVRIASSKRNVVYECLNCKSEKRIHY